MRDVQPYDITKTTSGGTPSRLRSPPDPAPAASSVTATATPGPADLVAFDTHVDPLAFLGGLVDRYGDAVRYRTKYGPCFLFVHPEHVHAILHDENYRRA